MATVILEDIYKRISRKDSVSNEHELIFSKALSVLIGCLTVFLAFVVSYMRSNMITIIVQIFGAFAAPILGVYLLGFFSSRVKSRSALVAFFLSLTFQSYVLFGSIFTVKPANKQGRRLSTSVIECKSSIDIISSRTPEASSHALVSLFSISPLWFIFNGTMITIIFGLIFSFFLDSKDSKIIDPSLLVSAKELFFCRSSTNKKSNKRSTIPKDDGISKNENIIEEESML